MSVHSLNTTGLDLTRALRLSLMVTPARSETLDRIDDAIHAAIGLRASAPNTARHNDISEAIDKMFEARALITGGRS